MRCHSIRLVRSGPRPPLLPDNKRTRDGATEQLETFGHALFVANEEVVCDEPHVAVARAKPEAIDRKARRKLPCDEWCDSMQRGRLRVGTEG